ncbi:hypothetical protein SAMN05216377_11118 [Pseudonocardia oroxyli]|uniref:Uncharacterized protein n=1 Tax=Pseudonocardia oroxyli TaxID=366584 RepID=A0A1G7THH5_PSEOR|nr:hypothetical protein SAMN05216377_11118 [Pseudonocardia oroxyli]
MVLLVLVGVLGGLLLVNGDDSGQGTAVQAAPLVTAAPTTTASASAAANRRVCIDFDARGGALYTLFVVPMMAGDGGRASVNVDIAQMRRATATVAQLRSADLGAASPSIADEGERLIAAADALGLYPNTDGTALLTAFVGLAVECQKANHKPSWFDANELAST